MRLPQWLRLIALVEALIVLIFIVVVFVTRLISRVIEIVVTEGSFLCFIIAVVLLMRNLLEPLDNFVNSCILRQSTYPVRNVPVHQECLHDQHQLRPKHSHLAVELSIYLLQRIFEPSYLFMQRCSFLFKKIPQLLVCMR